MELLQHLQNQIEKLKTNPSEVDIDQMVDLLSQAYELARDGLERSQSAVKFLDAQKKINELEPQVTTLEEKVSTLTAANQQLSEKQTALIPFIEHLRKCAGGKVEVLKSLSRERKDAYAEKIKAAEGEGLVELIMDIENRFTESFKDSTRMLTETGKSFVNVDLYKS